MLGHSQKTNREAFEELRQGILSREFFMRFAASVLSRVPDGLRGG
jgi:hypothetical protein